MQTITKINVVIPKDMHAELLKRARRERETISVIVRRAVMAYVRDNP